MRRKERRRRAARRLITHPSPPDHLTVAAVLAALSVVLRQFVNWTSRGISPSTRPRPSNGIRGCYADRARRGIRGFREIRRSTSSTGLLLGPLRILGIQLASGSFAQLPPRPHEVGFIQPVVETRLRPDGKPARARYADVPYIFCWRRAHRRDCSGPSSWKIDLAPVFVPAIAPIRFADILDSRRSRAEELRRGLDL